MAELVTKTDLRLAFDNLGLRLTIRTGVIAAGLTILGAVLKLPLMPLPLLGRKWRKIPTPHIYS